MEAEIAAITFVLTESKRTRCLAGFYQQLNYPQRRPSLYNEQTREFKAVELHNKTVSLGSSADVGRPAVGAELSYIYSACFSDGL